jgi:hypothetical protein
MSECLFDPTAPGCETAPADVGAADVATFDFAAMGPPKSPSDLQITQYEFLFGIGTFAMMANGIKIWQWYPKAVRDNNYFYPDRIEGLIQHDETWAL